MSGEKPELFLFAWAYFCDCDAGGIAFAILIDFDFAANNGGWQWAASTGCDAQPWFRIFNPILQSEKFDPEGKFIKKYLPSLEPLNKKQIHAPWVAFEKEPLRFPILLGKDYPNPIVSHKDQREKALKMYDLKNVA